MPTMFAKGVMQLLAEKKNPFHFSKSHNSESTVQIDLNYITFDI